MKTETMQFDGERLPIVRRRILSRKVEQFDGPQIPFHELLEAQRIIEHTPAGPRKIAKGKPMRLPEYIRAQSENPNRVFYGETVAPAFVLQLVVTFADFRFISAPWGSAENPPTEYFQNAAIEDGRWLVLPDGMRVAGITDADLPADERAANAAQLAGDALGAVLDATHAKNKPRRKTKDPRPLPPPDARAEYSSKIWDLLPVEHSNRALARKAIEWARERGEKSPAGFGRWKLLGESGLAKEAGQLRKDWTKEKAKRRKRR